MPLERAVVTMTPTQSALVRKLFAARDELNTLLNALPDSGLGVVALIIEPSMPYWPRLQLKPCVVIYEDEVPTDPNAVPLGARRGTPK